MANIQHNEEITDRSPQGRYIRFNTRLGSGAYKTVYKAYDTREGIEVAWNQVDIALMPKSEKNRIIQEVKLLQTLEHKNIINFHGSWVNREKQQVVFITEIVTSGTLSSFIKRVQLVRWKIIKRWCRQILEGLKYLHSHNPPIIHRDLKCDNIFINGSTGDLRIGDLGLSTQMAVGRNAQSVLGTPEFMAPELYDENYDEKVDIYAFGMCVLEMITKQIPYMECLNPAQIYKKVTAVTARLFDPGLRQIIKCAFQSRKGIRPAALYRVKSQEAREFIELCLSRGGGLVDVNAEYLLNSPFLQEGPNDDEEVIVDAEPELPRDHATSVDEVELDEDIENNEFDNFPKNTILKRRGSVPVTRSLSVDNDVADGSSLGPVPGVEEALPLAPQSDVYHPVDAEGILEEMPDVEPAVRSRQMTIMSGRGEILQEPDTRPESQWGLSPVVRAAREAEAARASDAKLFMAQFQKSLPENRDGRAQMDTPPGAASNVHQNLSPKEGFRVTAAGLQQVAGGTGIFVSGDQSGKMTGGHTAEGEPATVSHNVFVVPQPAAPDPGKRRKGKHEIKSLPDPAHENSILLMLRVYLEGKSKEIKFSFNLYTDSPHEVSCELAFDVGIPESEVEDIAHSIAYLVTDGKVKRYEKGHIDIWDDAPEPHPFNYRPVGRPQGSGPVPPIVSENAGPGSPSGRTLVGTAPPTVVLGPPASDKPGAGPESTPLNGIIGVPPVLPVGAASDPQPTSLPPAAVQGGSASIMSPNPPLQTVQPLPSGPTLSVVTQTPPQTPHLTDDGSIGSPSQLSHPYFFSQPASPPVRIETDDDPELNAKKKEYEKQLKVATSAFDHRDFSLERAMRDEEEKHRKEMERHRKRMEEFQRKKQRALEMREQRLMKFEAEWREHVQNERNRRTSDNYGFSTSSGTFSGNVTPRGDSGNFYFPGPNAGTEGQHSPHPGSLPLMSHGGSSSGHDASALGSSYSLAQGQNQNMLESGYQQSAVMGRHPGAFEDLLQHPMLGPTAPQSGSNGNNVHPAVLTARSSSLPNPQLAHSPPQSHMTSLSGNWAATGTSGSVGNVSGGPTKESSNAYSYGASPALTNIVKSSGMQNSVQHGSSSSSTSASMSSVGKPSNSPLALNTSSS